MEKFKIPTGEIGILEARKPRGRKLHRFLAFGNRSPAGVQDIKVVVSFPPEAVFDFQIPKEDLGVYAPMAVSYTVVPHDCTEAHWHARKKDFAASFSQKLAAFKKNYEGMMLNDMVRKGILLRLATEAAQGCLWSVVVLGVGPAICHERDPFDEPKG